MHTTESLLLELTQAPETVTFQDTIAVIDSEYDFTPSAFRNGEQHNQANENNGSCKILTFAKLHHLSEAQTPHLFGDFYRLDVLGNPDGSDHQNIRQFLIHGWDGVVFEETALVAK